MGENIFSKSIPVFVLLWSFMTQQALGQIADNFADGNLTSDPAWAGSTANYIVNGSGRLQLNAPVAGSSFLSLPFSIPTNHNTQWEFVIAHNFSASTQNLTRVYLMSDTQDPLAIQNGYFLQFGETGSNDPIDLFKVTGGNASSIFRGTLGFVAAAFNIRVRVTRSSTGTWEIFADNMAVSNFTSQGSVVDNTVQASSFFILRSTYTIGNISNFSYDDFVITTTPAPDVTAPGINSVSVLSASEINLNFSEALDATSPLNASQFVLNDTIAANAAAYAENNTTIQLTFPHAMVNGRIQKIQFPSVSDLSANVLASGHQNFLFFQPVDPQPHDLIINEIYADPSPSIGLPEFEFVEIYNRSQHPFQLENWQLTDGTTTATLSAKILLPGEFLTVTPNAASAAFSGLGPTMGVTTFPSLNNSGDNLQLKSPDGIEIDAQPYALAWYHDEDKDAGGFSLERIDPTSFCKGADNWRASSHAIGGTPGHQNSAWQITPDVTGPRLLEVIPKTSKVITLKFDERMDATLPQLSNFNFSADVAKTTANFTNAALTDLDLEFAADLDSTVVYTVTLSGFFDCPGNALQSSASSASFKMDMVKPTIVSLAVLSQTQIQLNFSEKLLSASVSTASFSIEQNAPLFSFGQSADRKSVVLTFAAQLTNGKEYTMTVRQLSDDAANVMIEDHRTFRFFQPIAAAAKDVVINEFLADQSPIVGLPEGEFIEIYNRSNKPFNLSGWKITDGSSTGTLPDKIILPDQYFILCPVSLASQYQNFGTALALSTFPSLNNSGDQIKLTDPSGLTIDSIQYSSAWYQDDDKEDGGWAIERINPNDFCGETENWKAGENPLGGTPGTVNSVFALTEDKISPDLVSVSVIRSDSLVVHFSERLSASTRSQTNFVFEPELQIQKLDFTALDRRHIAFKLSTSLDSTTQYQLRAQQIFDCPGNLIHPDSTRIAFKLDNVAPVVTRVLTNSPTRVTIAFSERMNVSLVDRNNFSIDDFSPESISVLDPSTFELHLKPALVNGKKSTLTITGLSDRADNFMMSSQHNLMFFESHPVSRKDIIITEIQADPAPVVGLPETEYVEIYNRSANPVQLDRWIIADESNEARLPKRILLPQEYLVLTVSSKAFQFQHALGVNSFPGLTNAGEPLILKDSTGRTVDSVHYTVEWHDHSEKADGGWALELIDPENICSEGENWTSSTDEAGGTPGRENSVKAEKPDLTPPVVTAVFALSADTLTVAFNEKLNEQLPSRENFAISPPLTMGSVFFADKSKRAYTIALSTPIQNRTRYQITFDNIADCAGNAYRPESELYFALPEKAEPGDIIVNEILFNPRPTGVDFVELFNRSEKYINLKDWNSANLVNDTLTNKKEITNDNIIFAPGDFLVLTTDPNTLKGEYLQGDEQKMSKTSLPSLSDDEGSFVLLDDDQMVIDTLFYSDDQHSPFLKNDEGVSLERIDVHSSSAGNNWQSASASSGYATPGLPNSNAFQNLFEDAVSVNPEIFSPQNGQPDFAMISYNVEHAGFVANVKIVNQQGRVIKEIAENELLGVDGFFTWRGDTAQGGRAASGAYMVWFEMVDANGNVVTIKKRVVVAERF